MGVGGKFWELLKPYGSQESVDFLRDKRVAVDLSLWIVQQETATVHSNSYVRKPHLRLTFFRTINLLSKFGAFPVFVVDGAPSPLKSQARIARFYRCSNVEASSFPVAEEGVSVERNGAFLKCVQECVELLELFGMPILKANGEAEALCAQLNREGHVDACITADSDAFLYGAICVIKSLRPNSKEPFECYHMSDIEAGLGLKREHLIAISLLVGNDHDLNGVKGIGLDNALRFTQMFGPDDILNSLIKIGGGDIPPQLQRVSRSADDTDISLIEISSKPKASHCSFCGHPGSKRVHFNSSCELCDTIDGEGCIQKPEGFKCNCSSCDEDRKLKEQQKLENWQMKVCDKIQKELNFPSITIIEMYLCENHGQYTDGDPCLAWQGPNIDMMVDFLVYHQLFEPSYIRQRMVPVLSTMYLREMSRRPKRKLLYDQYEFDSIQRVKIRYGHRSYVVKWRKAIHSVVNAISSNDIEDNLQEETLGIDESTSQTDEINIPQIVVDNGNCYLLTDENMELVGNAFPEQVGKFLKEKELRETKRKKCSRSEGLKQMCESPGGVQLSINEFYRSTKAKNPVKHGEEAVNDAESEGHTSPKEKRKVINSSLPKSVRRRLLFK